MNESWSTERSKKLDFPAWAYAVLPLLFTLRYLNAPPDARTYGPTHWFLNYHHGFIRRALVGQIFAPFHFISWRSVFIIEAATTLCAVALSYAAFRSVLFGNLKERRLAAFLLSGPAFLPHLAYMAGELDTFLYLAALLAAWVLTQQANCLGLVAATILTFIGLAMHEAFLLMFYPLILALLIDGLHRRRLKPLWVGVHGAAVAAFFVGLITVSQRHALSPDWIAEARRRTDMPIQNVVPLVLHNSLWDQVHLALALYDRATVAKVLLTLLLSIPYGVILWRLCRSTLEARGYSLRVRRVVGGLFFLPLLLLPLGHDVIRWLAAGCIDISVYVLFSYMVDSHDPERVDATSQHLARWNAEPGTSAAFLYLVALGPWGLTGNRLFANLQNIIGKQ